MGFVCYTTYMPPLSASGSIEKIGIVHALLILRASPVNVQQDFYKHFDSYASFNWKQ